ncbi:MAG: CDP-archaeol synthase, partial [Candidatus Paceibacterota bacterium]
GLLSAVLITYLQTFVLIKINFLNNISIVDYQNINFVVLGFLFGFGALFGDLVKSFFKRRINKESSESWKIIDQLDYVIGSLIFVSLIFTPTVLDIFVILIISLVLTIIVNQIGWIMGFRKERW